MKIKGYSERGFINALFYSIQQSKSCDELLRELLGQIEWPQLNQKPRLQKCSTVMIEQNFSEFGEPDVLLLFGENSSPAVIFAEAKRGKHYKLRKEWEKFSNAVEKEERPKGLTSNVFCQLYFKQRMAESLKDGAEEFSDTVVPFDEPLNKKGKDGRKIGKNEVVLKAAKEIEPYVKNPYFLMIIPQKWEDVKDLWEEDIKSGPKNKKEGDLDGWDTKHWGVLPLPRVNTFCREKESELPHVVEVLNHNEGQLF